MNILVYLIFEIFKKARRRTSFETGSKSITTPSIQAGTRKVQRALPSSHEELTMRMRIRVMAVKIMVIRAVRVMMGGDK